MRKTRVNITSRTIFGDLGSDWFFPKGSSMDWSFIWRQKERERYAGGKKENWPDISVWKVQRTSWWSYIIWFRFT